MSYRVNESVGKKQSQTSTSHVDEKESVLCCDLGNKIMQYQVFVQSRPDGFFSATVVGVPDCGAEGTTQEEALTKAAATLRARLARGKLFTVEVDEAPITEAANPWLESHGSLRDDPTFDGLMNEIAQARRQLEAEEPQP